MVFLVISILFIRPSSLISISWVASLSISLGCFLAAFLVVKGMDKRPVSSIGLEVSKVWWIEFRLGVLIAFLAQTIIFRSNTDFPGWKLQVTDGKEQVLKCGDGRRLHTS